jgi:hypothetical protein
MRRHPLVHDTVFFVRPLAVVAEIDYLSPGRNADRRAAWGLFRDRDVAVYISTVALVRLPAFAGDPSLREIALVGYCVMPWEMQR